MQYGKISTLKIAKLPLLISQQAMIFLSRIRIVWRQRKVLSVLTQSHEHFVLLLSTPCSLNLLTTTHFTFSTIWPYILRGSKLTEIFLPILASLDIQICYLVM